MKAAQAAKVNHMPNSLLVLLPHGLTACLLLQDMPPPSSPPPSSQQATDPNTPAQGQQNTA